MRLTSTYLLSVVVVMQVVSSEYATRYLEQIGVKPSKATLDMVHKNISLTDNCVKTTFRVRTGARLWR